MGDGRGSLSCLIGEQAPVHSAVEGVSKRSAEEATGGCSVLVNALLNTEMKAGTTASILATMTAIAPTK